MSSASASASAGSSRAVVTRIPVGLRKRYRSPGLTAQPLACLPFAPALLHEAGRAGAGTAAWVVYLGAVPTALGFATWSFALRRTSAGRMAALAYLIPVVAIVLGWAVLGERPAWLAAAGGGLCLAGVALARR